MALISLGATFEIRQVGPGECHAPLPHPPPLGSASEYYENKIPGFAQKRLACNA